MAEENKDDLMRYDLQESLKRHCINPRQLSTFQRILLTTDGTVTEILEAYLYEKIQVWKLSQRSITLNENLDPLNLKKGEKTIERKFFCRGLSAEKTSFSPNRY